MLGTAFVNHYFVGFWNYRRLATIYPHKNWLQNTPLMINNTSNFIEDGFSSFVRILFALSEERRRSNSSNTTINSECRLHVNANSKEFAQVVDR